MNIKKTSNFMKVFLVFICFGLISCQNLPVDTAAEKAHGVTNLELESETDSGVSKEESKIYSHLLNSDKSLSGSRIFIVNRTISGLVKPYTSLKEVLRGVIDNNQYSLPEDLSKDYISKNEKSIEISNDLELKHDHKVAEASEFNIDDFGAVYGFSRIGFNQQRNLALVYVEYSAGPKNGGGTFIVLTKVDGQWGVSKRFTLWIS